MDSGQKQLDNRNYFSEDKLVILILPGHLELQWMVQTPLLYSLSHWTCPDSTTYGYCFALGNYNTLLTEFNSFEIIWSVLFLSHKVNKSSDMFYSQILKRDLNMSIRNSLYHHSFGSVVL